MKKTQYGDYAKWVTFEVMANFQVRLILTDDLLKSATMRGLSAASDNADAFCFHLKATGLSYLVLNLNSPEATVAHECWHIVHRVLTYCGVADMDDEIVAYHLDHLVEQVYKFKNAIQSASRKEKTDEPKRKRRTGGAAASKRRNR